jgi:hypothetical protein
MKRSKTNRNAQKRSGTVNGQERLGTFESERSNALGRIAENDHGHGQLHAPITKELL